MKEIPEEDFGMFFPSTLKEKAQKWYYKYAPKKLTTYEKTRKAFLMRFRDEKTDEEILCDLGKIKQRNNSVRGFVERLKDLTKQLEEEPTDTNMRAWFLNRSNNKKLKNAEVLTPTATFDELVARALKIEKKSRSSSDSESSDSSDSDSSSSSSSDASDTKKDRKKKKSSKKSSKPDTLKIIELLTQQIKKLTAQRITELSRGEKWCVHCRMSNHSTEECKQCDFCVARGHLWENCKARLRLMMKKGQEVRMVTNAQPSDNTEASTSYGGRGSGRVGWRGGRVGRGPRVYTCFQCGKEGHFAADCPDKAIAKRWPLNMSQELKKSQSAKASKSPQMSGMNKECLVAAKISEEFSKMAPEKPETSHT